MSGRRATSDRADLLAALVLAGNDTRVALRLAQVLGYRRAAAQDADVSGTGRLSQPALLQDTQPQVGRHGDAQPLSGQLAPLLAEHAGVVSVQPLALAAVSGQGADGVEGLTSEACQPRAVAAPAFVPLVPPTRLWPALKASLTIHRQGAVDVRRLVATLGRGGLPARLPRQQQQLWGGGLWLVLDVAEPMHPYAQDFEQLQRALIQLRGAAGLRHWTVAGRPDEVLAGPQTPAHRHRPRVLPLPPPGTVVLLLTDLGALSDHPAAQAAWCRYAGDLRRAGAIPVCWAPLASRQVGLAAADALAVHCLQPGPGLRAQRGGWRTAAQRLAEQQRLAGLRDALLLRAACCVQLEPAMLRALRLGSPALRGEPAVEGLLWAHRPALTTSLRSRPLTAPAAALWRPRLADLPVPDRLAVLAAMRRVHASRGRSTEMMEALIWWAHAQLPAAALPAALAQHVEDAQRWLAALAKAAAEPGLPLPGLVGYARDLLARQGADEAWMASQSAGISPLWALTGAQSAPPGLAPADLLRARQALGPKPRLQQRLMLRGQQLWLVPADHISTARVTWIDAARSTGAVVLRVAGGRQWVVDVAQTAQHLLTLTPDSLPCEVGFDEAMVRIDTLRRQPWAVEWGRDNSGVYALTPPLGELQHRFDVGTQGAVDALHPLVTSAEFRRLSPPIALGRHASWCWALDREFGLSGELMVSQVVQRFRYLPPGDFSMGSPDNEPEHYSDEGPCHRVRLTEGFWLADTACTQALWQAVMGGSNPSHFSGDAQHPVEQVNWDDVQTFLQRLQPHLPPGCQAVLPTEAQWEYACRAGSSTAFNTGTQISRETVNFNAAQDTPLAVRGEESQSTVPVKSLPPNAWGLYEMHGNVLEWCADAQRDYAKTANLTGVLENPFDPQEQGPEALRAVRGGSSFGDARSARSACRLAYQRQVRFHLLGFRFALRSTSPEALEGPAKPAAPEGRSGSVAPEGRSIERQPGRGPEAQGQTPRPGAAPARNIMGRVRDALGLEAKPKPPTQPPTQPAPAAPAKPGPNPPKRKK